MPAVLELGGSLQEGSLAHAELSELMNSAAGFGEALRAHRYALRLTQAQLAERAGLSERAISDLERGLKTPQRATLSLLINALELSPDQVESFDLAVRPPRAATEQPAANQIAPTPSGPSAAD